jgi:hypothetical protein
MPGWPHVHIAIAVVVLTLVALGFMPMRLVASLVQSGDFSRSRPDFDRIFIGQICREMSSGLIIGRVSFNRAKNMISFVKHIKAIAGHHSTPPP